MDRQIVYPGQIPLETDLLNSNRFAMIAIAKLAAAMLGTGTVANGLACAPTSPASLQVKVGPGEMYSLAALDATDYSSLAADTTHNILKQGISLDDVLLTCTPPATAGQSINYLVQAAYQDSDTGLVTLPYYNASNPQQAWSGPNNSGAQQATARKGVISINAKAGVAATTGSQTTPAPDAGCSGLWVVTVANGQTTITAGNIVAYSAAPFLSAPLLTQVKQAPAVVGMVRNLVMSVTTASATATLSADEIVVESALGGNTYKLANFSQVINLGATGAGGMDAGAAPANGWVAVYAIYNPATGARALLGVNATSAAAPEVYGGGNMPAGYSASALVSVRRTNGSGQFAVGAQLDRSVETGVVSVLASGAATTYTAVSISSTVPPNARYVSFTFGMSTNGASNGVYVIATDPTNEVGLRRALSPVATQILGGAWNDVRLVTPQSVLYKNDAVGGTLGLNVVGYKF
ncbi:hypothetical protein [Cupriavidus pauculus]|uniref:Uncharacterized protein n=1 Tax=Cupriavidus pauculus TaxID=82633 RepID=A0A3G8H3D6_9BURK|nr:hypothetical protein [Cupriavidus pauculus]AZG14924.1 hypothetical protein EHF44_16685 [Cupriavidus pauculus]